MPWLSVTGYAVSTRKVQFCIVQGILGLIKNLIAVMMILSSFLPLALNILRLKASKIPHYYLLLIPAAARLSSA